MVVRTVTIFTAFPIGRLARRPGSTCSENGAAPPCVPGTRGAALTPGWQACLGAVPLA